jgi:hypothetical protein
MKSDLLEFLELLDEYISKYSKHSNRKEMIVFYIELSNSMNLPIGYSKLGEIW